MKTKRLVIEDVKDQICIRYRGILVGVLREQDTSDLRSLAEHLKVDRRDLARRIEKAVRTSSLVSINVDSIAPERRWSRVRVRVRMTEDHVQLTQQSRRPRTFGKARRPTYFHPLPKFSKMKQEDLRKYAGMRWFANICSIRPNPFDSVVV